MAIEEEKQNEGSAEQQATVQNQAQKKSKIIEPIEEAKINKQLNDLTFTYVICSSCFNDKKYPSVMSEENFERCAIETLLTKPSIDPNDKHILTDTEMEALQPEGEWSTEQTIKLLELINEHGENWDEIVNQLDNSKSKEQCISHFINLPINENTSEKFNEINAMAMKTSQAKEQHVQEQNSIPTVFSDISNPIQAQVALFGRLLEYYGLDDEGEPIYDYSNNLASGLRSQTKQESGSNHGHDMITTKEEIPESQILSKETTKRVKDKSIGQSKLLAKRQRKEMKKLMSMIVEMEMKKIQNKVEYLDKLDTIIQKEKEQIKEMHSQIFAERMSLALSRNSDKPI